MSAAEKRMTIEWGADFSRKEAHWRRDRNLRDVLAHLYEWQQLLLTWETDNRQGNPRPFLPPTHTWRTTPELNVELWAKHQATSLPEIMELLAGSHTRMCDLIERFTDDELFIKAYFPWTGSTSLGQYCVSETSSHYHWARKKLRVFMSAARAS